MIQGKINDLIEMEMADLPPEDEIMSTWQGHSDQPEVSVICATYNQEDYIEDALKGFLIQKTDFPFEIVVQDDASTDSTAEIIKKYERRYPNIIKPIIQNENKKSKGKKPTSLMFPCTQGRLITLCQGDDFWFNPNKLALQEAMLKKYPQVDFCTHPAAKIGVTGNLMSMILGKTQEVMVTASDVVRGGGDWCATSSIMVRRSVIQCFLEHFRDAPVGDLFIQCLGAVKGGVVVVDEVASVYRVGTPGSWNGGRGAKDRLILFHDEMQKSLSRLGELNGFLELQGELNMLRSMCSYGTSVDYLRRKDYQMFALMISTSFHYRPFLSVRQALLYFFSIPIRYFFYIKGIRIDDGF